MSVDILLATYNGDRYLKDLLESLFNQTYSNWNLLIRDDCSTDNTIEIIQQYIAEHPAKIRVIDNDKKRLGSTLSFSKLIEFSTAPYIMFCDQDDVWLADKILISLKKLEEMEVQFGNVPLMVFTDLKTVDVNLKILSESFIKSQKLFTTIINDPVKLLALNIVTGCTIMINSFSKKYISPITSKRIIHDQWIAANIAYWGHIGFIDQSTVLYRQHSENVVGSPLIKVRYFWNKLKKPRRQIAIYYDLISGLKFKVNVFKFIYYKMLFSIRRLSDEKD